MRYIILLFFVAILTASIAQADVCIEQPPGEVICVPESPIMPSAQYQVFLPRIEKGE